MALARLQSWPRWGLNRTPYASGLLYRHHSRGQYGSHQRSVQPENSTSDIIASVWYAITPPTNEHLSPFSRTSISLPPTTRGSPVWLESLMQACAPHNRRISSNLGFAVQPRCCSFASRALASVQPPLPYSYGCTTHLMEQRVSDVQSLQAVTAFLRVAARCRAVPEVCSLLFSRRMSQLVSDDWLIMLCGLLRRRLHNTLDQ
jgi:hypothetical protein